MKTLKQLKIPSDLYSKLEFRAIEHNNSIETEFIELLQQTFGESRTYPDQAKLLTEIRRRRFAYPKDQPVADSVQLLREDRNA
jgi:plasmid stability protein